MFKVKSDNMIEIEIFVKKDCAFCPRAKEIVEKVVAEFEDVVIKEVNTETDEGKEKVEFLGILTIPTVIVSKEIRFSGVPREELLREAIKKELAENEESGQE